MFVEHSYKFLFKKKNHNFFEYIKIEIFTKPLYFGVLQHLK